MKFPQIVTREEWQKQRLALLTEEKALSVARDHLNARRRRMPMTLVEKPYVFESTKGPLRFIDLFEQRPQLIVYHNMLKGGSDFVCPGCSYYSDHVANLDHLHARRTTFVEISRAPVPQIESVKARMGWKFPWYSCAGTSFHEDFVASEKQSFGLSVFLNIDAKIYQTYFTSGRGVEQPSNTFGFLDITPFGRQETWEDSPEGWPQEPAHSWLRLHDEYDAPT